MSQPKEAQEIIVDGLLEATHYLCKLGSNLRLRATNLKNNKIIKTNLSTTDDIHGAVKKLSLICDLTKKSLDFVEDGVSKVLKDYKHRLKWQSKVHKKVKDQSENSQPTRTPKWHTIEYDNLVLKISKKICISQYTTAQVSLKRLNQAIIDKYIGQYCKIYKTKSLKSTTASIDDSKKEIDSERCHSDRKKQRQASSDKNKQTVLSEHLLSDKKKKRLASSDNNEQKLDSEHCPSGRKKQRQVSCDNNKQKADSERCLTESKKQRQASCDNNDQKFGSEHCPSGRKKQRQASCDNNKQKADSECCLTESKKQRQASCDNIDQKLDSERCPSDTKKHRQTSSNNEPKHNASKIKGEPTNNDEIVKNNTSRKKEKMLKLSEKKEVVRSSAKEHKEKLKAKKLALEEEEDEETVKSLGKLSSTAGNDSIRIKCVDINKLIDKAKELNCRLGFRTIKKKTEVDSKIEIKKNIKLPFSEKPLEESKINFVAKPFDIKVIRLHNNLEKYKDNCNIKKIMYRNKEISNLFDVVTNLKDKKKTLNGKNDKMQKEADGIDAGNRKEPLHSEIEDEKRSSLVSILKKPTSHLQDNESSSDFELRYSDSINGEDVPAEQDVPAKGDVPAIDDSNVFFDLLSDPAIINRDAALKQSKDLDITQEKGTQLVKHSNVSEDDKLNKNVTEEKVSLMHELSSGEDSFTIRRCKARKEEQRKKEEQGRKEESEELMLTPPSVKKKNQTLSSSSSKSEKPRKIVKKVRFE